MIKVYFDGASAGDPGPSGAGIYIILDNGEQKKEKLPLGQLSNHESEFIACREALKLCLPYKEQLIICHTDSQIVENSFDKEYAKKEAYASILKEIIELKKQFSMLYLKWIPTKENPADSLSKQAIQLNKG